MMGLVKRILTAPVTGMAFGWRQAPDPKRDCADLIGSNHAQLPMKTNMCLLFGFDGLRALELLALRLVEFS